MDTAALLSWKPLFSDRGHKHCWSGEAQELLLFFLIWKQREEEEVGGRHRRSQKHGLSLPPYLWYLVFGLLQNRVFDDPVPAEPSSNHRELQWRRIGYFIMNSTTQENGKPGLKSWSSLIQGSGQDFKGLQGAGVRKCWRGEF